ncbi:tRNA-(ms[2]io[6]A)-hydroxylase [bacterium (Candidatus Blackallbacteria) CG17_big_fil_post_rev_8_21_14_2_50_48_46]|uniref:tRNA-(Ms[2]io[6]A)-hydroxylase n=1 Tax=bacterium (Candidatus Blackallbacteria) CG17_big_fil_post_rev_8_21_14_2_50_48_46 TaxID=2014261 RepID=A0A2M7FY99_9BACT|nr:MAG: tRNA-(ms[2]io[6]A)-hydroxylase [bacterium (Candidatus Blackallbacteria) CG18_big_fil_WC_8_21_14_2_50_49_26]PIW14142.1 MAG: tRNA-(ms[2]io[6]A)-hydroxylase [bacterium (Candidatus Blackallbacteria) CG17_big_fil_post_rev_8_21_14_2_50_48_46]PIW45872.1 MAG: tRNA-(ms[2]io[6]A)-hydroxylase [bacterium (Candidatus Blackallbacteria) CG13_big_fil_rev_8_21_14_2_50_49_14]
MTQNTIDKTHEKIDFELKCPTDPGWAQVVVDQFDPFLQDHANCERKASALAMSLIMKYSDKLEIIPHMIRLAQEELEHFRQVYALMEERGIRMGKEIKDPYVNQLLEACRTTPEERFLDRMLISSIIEARGAERFALVSEALPDERLKAFYHRLWASELKHGHLFVNLMLNYFPREVIEKRLDQLLEVEAGIIPGLEWRPSLH